MLPARQVGAVLLDARRCRRSRSSSLPRVRPAPPSTSFPRSTPCRGGRWGAARPDPEPGGARPRWRRRRRSAPTPRARAAWRRRRWLEHGGLPGSRLRRTAANDPLLYGVNGTAGFEGRGMCPVNRRIPMRSASDVFFRTATRIAAARATGEGRRPRWPAASSRRRAGGCGAPSADDGVVRRGRGDDSGDAGGDGERAGHVAAARDGAPGADRPLRMAAQRGGLDQPERARTRRRRSTRSGRRGTCEGRCTGFRWRSRTTSTRRTSRRRGVRSPSRATYPAVRRHAHGEPARGRARSSSPRRG